LRTCAMRAAWSTVSWVCLKYVLKGAKWSSYKKMCTVTNLVTSEVAAVAKRTRTSTSLTLNPYKLVTWAAWRLLIMMLNLGIKDWNTQGSHFWMNWIRRTWFVGCKIQDPHGHCLLEERKRLLKYVRHLLERSKWRRNWRKHVSDLTTW